MDDSPLIFAEESKSRTHGVLDRAWKIMVIDDEKSVHDITSLSLREFTYEGKGVRFINAFSAKEAIECLDAHPDTALMLVDVVMESEDAGLKLVHYVRESLKNDLIQMVIRTGQPGFAPEDQVISKYGINSYFSKTEVTSEKLVSLVTTSLRTYQLAMALNRELGKRRQAEKELRELNRDLEEKIKERTQELSRANQLKSQFLANMSHEIRTPLNGVIGMANLLLDENLTQEQAEFAGIIHSSANTLLALINDILDLSKIEAGQLEFEVRPFSVEKLIGETLAMFRMKADEKGLNLISSVAAPLSGLLAGDEVRIKQILVNLVGNALKFTDSGSIRVTVTQEDEGEGHLVLGLEVSDTGPGIDEAFKSRLFDKFSQQDASTTRKYGGTGLGLAITKQLAAMMRGDIRAWNKEEGGAVFKVTIRVDRAKGMETGSDNRTNADETRQRSELVEHIRSKDLKILIAEDNPTNQKVIRLLLEKMGQTPDVVENGIEVLEHLAITRYDLLLMDVQMPRLDGIATARAIRKGGKAQDDLPIIALTALAMPEDAELCKKAGMDQVLTKPVHPQKLAKAIADAIGF